MANTTDPFAESVHGTNPQYLVEKITRLKIYNSRYWKESCFGLTSETIVDKAISLKYCGGTYGGSNKPSDFICLVLKLLQLQPELDIVIEFIKNEDFKYLRVLGAFYMRLVGKPEDIFHYLEPLYEDYRKIAYRGMAGWSCKHMDEFIDSLLVEELVCDIALPHLPKRIKLEQLGILDERTSILDADLLNAEEDAVIAAYNLKIASQEKNVNDGKLSAPDATPVLKPSDKKKPLDEPSPGNEEYISEYRRDDVRSRKAAAVCNDDDSRKDVEERGEKIREHSADRGRSRRDSGGEKYGPGVNSGRGDQRDNGRDRDKRYIPLRRSGSRDKARRRERDRKSEHDHSRSRSRTRDRRRDRDDRGSDRYVSHRDSDSRRRESDHNRKGRDRARSRSYDSRSRSPINKHKKESRKSSSKEYDYDKRERRRDRERSLSSKKRSKESSRRSGGSRHRAASCDSEDVRGKSRRHPRSPSLSRSRSRSSSRSSSSSQSESDRERRRKRISSSAAKKSEDDISESAEDSAQVVVSLAEEKAAAMKASKAEKKFDKMFKTKKTNTEGDSQGSSSVAVKAHPEGSVEYWNQIREGLGIKKLKS